MIAVISGVLILLAAVVAWEVGEGWSHGTATCGEGANPSMALKTSEQALSTPAEVGGGYR